MADAFIDGKPLIERQLTVSGGAVQEPRNVIVPIGMLAGDILQMAHVNMEYKFRQVIFGGLLMGMAVPGTGFPIEKGTSGLLFLTEDEVDEEPESQCLRCGRCMRTCPCRLSPALMHQALESRDYGRAAEIGLMDCLECGACAYVCPSRLRLTQRFRVGKQLYKEEKKREAAHAR
jgi:electron transport complex protein RnfC